MTQVNKELSMKEKAEAYDKALEKFHQFMDGYSRREISKEELEDIFPGFLEPEDEKIRKQILDCFRSMKQQGCFPLKHREQYDSWVSWLEKQGENKKEMNNFDVLPGLYKCTRRMYDRRTLDGKILFEVGNTYKCLSKHDKAEFEVSYGQSVYLEDPVVYRHFIPYIEQNDPKPTNTVKPVFEVGDWVVNKFGNIWHIDSFDAKNYQVTNNKGEHNHFPVNIQNRMRPWTIRDAEDGDVLAEDTCIFILKKLNHDLSAKIYCCLYDDGEFDDLTSNLVFDDTCTYPATAEQRDTLFQKIEEVGYSWDPEKKELKRTKQASTDKIRPKFKVGDRIIKSSENSCSVHSSTDDTICEVAEVHDTCYILNTKDGRIQVPLEWQDHYELVKPTWSEEDNKNKLSEEDINNLNRISTILYEAGQVQCWWKEKRLISKEESDYLCNWLKSLYNKLKL